MGILKSVLKDKFSIKYNGIANMATNLHIGALLEHEQEIYEYYNKSNYEIESEDSIRDYLVLNTILQYEEVVQNLKNDSDKVKLSSLIHFSKDTLDKYDKPLDQMYQLIDKNYVSLLSKEKDDYNRHNFIEIILDYTFKQYDRIKDDVFIFIEENHWGYILNHFESCMSFYKHHINELDLFLMKIYEFERENLYSNIDGFLMNYKIFPFIETFEKYAILLSKKAISLLKTINEDNYIEIYSFCENINKLAKRYDLKKQQNEFDAMRTLVDMTRISYLKKHGKVFKFEMPIKEMLDRLREQLVAREVATNIVFLTLTHTKAKDRIGYEPTINSTFEEPKSSFINFVRHIGAESNEKFTPSVQSNLRLNFGLHESFLRVIIQDKEISNVFFKILSKVLEVVCEKYNLDNNDLGKEFNGIIDAVVYLESIDDSYPYYRTFCFGLSQTICAFSEKILRKVYLEKYDKHIYYTHESSLTLGNLLDNNIIKGILGEKLLSILRFELHQIIEQDNGIPKIIGLNLRNKLMHNNDIDYDEDIHSGLVIHLFYILILIIQQIETTIIQFID